MKIDFRLPTTQSISKSILLSILIITSFYCAGQRSPSGGPPDTTPPEIKAIYPAPGALKYHDNKISLSFSKYITRRTLEESIFISPSLGELTFDWSGTDVEISFSDSLRQNTTYIMTIGTDLTDTRNNRLAKAFSLPFSTGEQIDSASISGVVLDEKPVGVLIYAYLLNTRNQDTLNPSHTKPDYLTQTGKDGSFTLPYLMLGTYRLLAIRDQYKDLLYNQQVDEYGVFNTDITLSSEKSLFTGVQFQITKEDTAPPFLSSARSVDNSHIILKFNEFIDPQSLSLDSVTVIDTISKSKIKLFDLSFDEVPVKEIQIVTAQQDSERIYRVVLAGSKDIYGNRMRASAAKGEFISKSVSDTTKPQFEIIGLPDNAKNIPVDDTVHVTFSEAIQRSSFESGFNLSDSLGNKVNGKFKWRTSMSFFFIPDSSLAFGMGYKLSIRLDSMKDFAGNTYRDSSMVRHFQTVDEKMLSSISGIVVDEKKDAKGRIYITAINVSEKSIKPRAQIINSPGQFNFTGLFEGKYTLSAFRDTDSNGVYTYGRPYPYQTSERFTIYPDTLKLRARWPLDGITIRFK